MKLLVHSPRSKGLITVGRMLAAAGIEMALAASWTSSTPAPGPDRPDGHGRRISRWLSARGPVLRRAPRRRNPRRISAEAERPLYRDFGQSLGIAFQMADDIVDAAGDPDVARKPVCATTPARAPISLPMIHAHRLAGEHPAICEASAAGEPLSPADHDAVYRLLADQAIRRECLLTMDNITWPRPRPSSTNSPPSSYRDGLDDLLEGIRQSALTTRHGDRAGDTLQKQDATERNK